MAGNKGRVARGKEATVLSIPSWVGTLFTMGRAYGAALSVARGTLRMRLAVAAVWTGLYFLGVWISKGFRQRREKRSIGSIDPAGGVEGRSPT